jgi:hypothetical protein
LTGHLTASTRGDDRLIDILASGIAEVDDHIADRA